MSDRSVKALYNMGWLSLILGLVFYLVMDGWSIKQGNFQAFWVGFFCFAFAIAVALGICIFISSLHRTAYKELVPLLVLTSLYGLILDVVSLGVAVSLMQ